MISKKQRIANNTLMLYFRQILILLVNLYTVRVVLKTLGAEDYGVFTAVGGVVTMLSFLSGSMAGATQRFFSFALGAGDDKKLNKIFNVNMLLYAAIAVVAVLLLETFGLWFTTNQLSIPEGRYDAAIAIYHYAVLAFVFGIFSSPLVAIIIAHEDMKIYAGVSIAEALMKLCVVFLLMTIPGDKLVLYGALLAVVALINILIYGALCYVRYKECRLNRSGFDKKILREVTGYTGWTLFGQISMVARQQVVTVMINQYFNPVIVAAKSIASSVTQAANMFGFSFNTSLYPPIIKEYAAGNKEEMYSLVFNGSKITFYLFWIVALPLILEMNVVLKIWLVDVPDYAIIFTILSLIEVLINSVSIPLTTAARAPGRMKTYELSIGILQLLIPLISLPLFHKGFPPTSVFYVAIAVNIIIFVVRLVIVGRLTGLPIVEFMKKVIIPVLTVAVVSFVISKSVQVLLPNNAGYSIIVMIVSIIDVALTTWFLGLDKNQRDKIYSTVISKFKVRLN